MAKYGSLIVNMWPQPVYYKNFGSIRVAAVTHRSGDRHITLFPRSDNHFHEYLVRGWRAQPFDCQRCGELGRHGRAGIQRFAGEAEIVDAVIAELQAETARPGTAPDF
jgi:hypothetical protein